MNMSVATKLGVKAAAERASNRKGGKGVLRRYIQAEIKRWYESDGERGLKADWVKPDPSVGGKGYWVIEESDFLEWESKRGRPPQENEP
jgi:hypothetical protein